jgi:hypothetical protein
MKIAVRFSFAVVRHVSFRGRNACRGRIELDITDAKACVDRPAMRRAFFMGISGHFQQVTGGPYAVGYTRAKRPELDWQ